MQKLPVSLVIITLNEQNNIERCIKSVPFASDIVVLDSGSLDQTLALAQKAGTEIGVEVQAFNQDWAGFGLQKQKVTELAKYDWVLNLDADEALSEELAAEIVQNFGELNPSHGYLLPRKSFHMGRWIMHGGWYPDRQLRLYNRKFARWSADEIHEKVIAKESAQDLPTSLPTSQLQSPMLHYVFKDLRHQIDTNNKYSGLQAEAFIKSGKHFSVLKLLFKPQLKFIECYFLKFGFLDGLPGFIIAVGAGYSVFLRWSKIWEHERSKK